MVHKINHRYPQPTFLARLNGPLHERTLWLFMVIVLAHWLEHVTQAYQIYISGRLVPDAGGALGLLFPVLVQSEVLHFTYNLFLLSGLLLLRPGFAGRSRWWWTVALIVQGWHFFEHTLLQVQWLTGDYLFGAAKQTSILQVWIPRVELHLLYNLIVFVPMLIGLYYHFYQPADEPLHTGCTCSRRQKVPPAGSIGGARA